MVTNTQLHKWVICKEWETQQLSVLNGISPSNPFPQGSWMTVEEEAENTIRAMDVEDTKDTKPSRHNSIEAHLNSQKLWQRAQDLHSPKSDGVLALRNCL